MEYKIATLDDIEATQQSILEDGVVDELKINLLHFHQQTKRRAS